MATKKSKRPRRYWLFKSEPEAYGIDEFERDGRTFWNGIRNYQARNLLRDEIRLDDGVLFYHSNAKPMAVVGLARVCKEGYPDHTQFEDGDKYHDPDSDPADPRWFMVDIEFVARAAQPVTRDMMKAEPKLDDMMLLQRGSRLSVQPVQKAEWQTILRMADMKESW
ncbi:MAG: EVE domain-containing protein [Planctomycetes bacterium]|nr:EVE domain-containing protein [Planctomycetota bacterium]